MNFDLAIRQGRMTPEVGRVALNEGRLAVDEIEGSVGVYTEGWENWRPDATLARPQMREDWDDLSMYDKP